jgi:hypothetical protein
MSQFASAFTAATAEAIATINDTIEYRQVEYSCVLSEETYGNTLGEGGFEPGREMSAMVALAGAPAYTLGARVKITSGGVVRPYRITGIDTDVASITLRLASPDAR